MFAYIDPILFPDECEVLQVSADRHVYPIFKNGSSSLRKTGYKKIEPDQLSELKVIEVFLRDPLDRYVSGVQTYLKNLGPKYDRETVLNLIDQHLFLNRHFSLQFHWLVNLARHTRAQIQIRSVTELSDLTSLNKNKMIRDTSLNQRYSGNSRLMFYLQLDRILIDKFMGQTVSFQDIVAYIKQHYPVLYQEVLARSQTLCSVLD
jgi:hypothetical protein